MSVSRLNVFVYYLSYQMLELTCKKYLYITINYGSDMTIIMFHLPG